MADSVVLRNVSKIFQTKTAGNIVAVDKFKLIDQINVKYNIDVVNKDILKINT